MRKIIQIGTNKGNDDLSSLIGQDEPSLLVLVEPMDIHNDNMKNHYGWVNNLHIENVFISEQNSDDVEFFYHLDDGPGFEISSYVKSHVIKHYPFSTDRIMSKKIKSVTINSLFEKYDLTHLDILFIDAEGVDDLIIKSIDFSKISIDEIYFENLHITQLDVYTFLESLGYKIIRNIGSHGWMSLAKK